MKIILLANTDWYLYNFRRALAQELQNKGHEVLLLSPDGPYGKKLCALGLYWQPVPLNRSSINPMRELWFINWLRNFILTEDVDLVHGFTIKCAIYGSLAARFAGDRSRISAVAGMGYIFTSQALRARLLRLPTLLTMRCTMGGKNSRLILQNSHDVSVFHRNAIIRKDRIRLIRGSGVNCRQFSGCAERLPGESMRVLLAARLLWDKGIAEYVEASRQLQAAGKDIHFLLAGTPDPGNPDSIPEQQVIQWQQQGLIQWLGHVDDMPTLLSSIHVMALPTVYGEGVPRSLIEGAASGLALIATDSPGCSELIEHEKNGLLVPLHNNVDALVYAIARLESDPRLARRLGAAAQKKARREFDEGDVITQTLAVYQELTPPGLQQSLHKRQNFPSIHP